VINLHSFDETNDETNSLIIPFNGALKGKGDTRAIKRPEVNKTSRAQKEEVNQNVATNVSECFLNLLSSFKILMAHTTKP
jgi:hypothetical protein